MSDNVVLVGPEPSPKGKLNSTDGKKLTVHAAIFGIAAILTAIIEAVVKSASDGSINLGPYTTPILGFLNVGLQLLRLLNNGPPKEPAPVAETP